MIAVVATFVGRGAPSSIVAPSCADSVGTESSTNVVFDAGDRYDRLFNFSLALEATRSNNVEVAFGRDANANGVLERVEKDLVVGWAAGKWFFRDRISGIVRKCARDEGKRRLDCQIVLNRDLEAQSIEMKDEDGRVFWGEVSRTMFDPSWDLMRVTTRGVIEPNGLVVTEIKGWGFNLHVR